jgi:hypothetical protein
VDGLSKETKGILLKPRQTAGSQEADTPGMTEPGVQKHQLQQAEIHG